MGFSNPGVTGNLSATTAGVSMDEFNQLKVGCDTLEAEVRELKASWEDSAIEINRRVNLILRRFSI